MHDLTIGGNDISVEIYTKLDSLPTPFSFWFDFKLGNERWGIHTINTDDLRIFEVFVNSIIF